MTAFLQGYHESLSSADSKKRYSDKLKLVDGIDPYEVKKNEWQDDVDLSLARNHTCTCVYVSHSNSKSPLRKGHAELQEPGLLPKRC